MTEEERVRRYNARRKAEAEGRVADSLEVRLALFKRMHGGEISLAQVQGEIIRLQRGAKAAGKITRHQAWLGR